MRMILIYFFMWMMFDGPMQRCFHTLPTLTIHEVSVAEQFLLGACRCWDAFTADPDPALPWRQLAPVFAYMNVLGAMCAFERLFAVLSSARTRLRFCEADAPGIHPDEARILSALAALQEADARSAVRVLRDILDDRCVRAAMPALARIASIMDSQGHRLPRWQPPLSPSPTDLKRPLWSPSWAGIS